MGIFNFLKRNENIKISQTIKCDQNGEYSITNSDLKEMVHQSKILNIRLSSDFEKEFAHLIIDKPMKVGELIELKTKNVTVEIWNLNIEVEFESENKNFDRFIEKLNHKLNWLAKNQELVYENIVNHLHNLKNKSWQIENQEKINETNFIKSIILKSIYFNKNSTFNLNFDAGNLFDGHFIEVQINSNLEIQEVNLEG